MLAENQEKVRSLLRDYYAGSIGEEEAGELALLLQHGRYDALVREVLAELAESVVPMEGEEAAMERMLVRIRENTAPARVRPVFWKRAAAAAAVVLALGAGGYYWLAGPQTHEQATAKKFGGDAMPGSEKAVLTLGDGSRLDLNDAQRGELAGRGGGNAVKTGQGSLAYNEATPAGSVQYHRLQTPRGGQYRLTLADGSTVWLNAGSSLRYPTLFTGKERAVELDGEAYFDVATDAEKPFIVKVRDGLSILVLGTGFNVQAYSDDAQSRTTLAEGAVLVRKGEASQLLRPGQEATAAGSGITLNPQADVAAATAWKNGMFVFRDAPMDMVMKQLSRWYNVEFVYEKGPVGEYFNGTIPRDVPLSKVLELLELTGLVHFTINGNTVTVTP